MSLYSLAKAFPLILRIVSLSLFFLLLILIPTLVVALGVAWLEGIHPLHEISILIGIVGALVTWLFVAIFHFRKESIRLACTDRAATLERVKTHLQEYGYELKHDRGDELSFTPSFRSLLLGGGLAVRVEGHDLVVTGPRLYLERLQHRSRLGSHIDQVQKTFKDSKTLDLSRPRAILAGERLLRQVRIQLEVPGKQLPDVYGDVVSALIKDGVEVHCAVTITGQSAQGIGENTIDLRIRQALNRRGIEADIHKELMEATTPLPTDTPRPIDGPPDPS